MCVRGHRKKRANHVTAQIMSVCICFLFGLLAQMTDRLSSLYIEMEQIQQIKI